MIRAILFDLDGTLLPMDQDVFIKAYFGGITKKMISYYEPKELVNAIWTGTVAMIKNDGSMTNEERWWKSFCEAYGAEAREHESELDDFYKNEFHDVKNYCGFSPLSKEIIELCRQKGFRTVLATNPVFPAIATKARIGWAGLEWNDFELVTTYENSRRCKPNLDYYRDILSQIGLSAQECVMVGNDVREDMIASRLGMRVFLLTDCMINKDNENIDKYPHGSFAELAEFISSL